MLKGIDTSANKQDRLKQPVGVEVPLIIANNTTHSVARLVQNPGCNPSRCLNTTQDMPAAALVPEHTGNTQEPEAAHAGAALHDDHPCPNTHAHLCVVWSCS